MYCRKRIAIAKMLEAQAKVRKALQRNAILMQALKMQEHANKLYALELIKR